MTIARGGLVRRVAIAAAVAALFWAASNLIAVAAHAAGVTIKAEDYYRYDSTLYMDIAQKGYTIFPSEISSDGKRIKYGGTTGWMPVYPILIRAMHTAGLPWVLSGKILAEAAWFAVLFILLFCFFRSEIRARSLLSLALASIFPGCIYYHAVFPISLFLVFALLCLYHTARRRYFLAAAFASVAAIIYSTGFLLAGVIALVVLNDDVFTHAKRLAVAAAVFLIGIACYLGLFVYFQIAFQQWDAFFKLQRNFGHGVRFPLVTIWHHTKALFTPASPHWVPAIQSASVFLLMICSCIIYWRGGFRGRLRSILMSPERGVFDQAIIIYLLSFYLFPLIMGQSVNPYRAESLLLPGVIMFSRVKSAGLAASIALFGTLAFAMARLFFASVLV